MSQKAKEGGASGKREESPLSKGGVSWSGYPRLCSGNEHSFSVAFHNKMHFSFTCVNTVGQKSRSSAPQSPGTQADTDPQSERRESTENCTASLQCFSQG